MFWQDAPKVLVKSWFWMYFKILVGQFETTLKMLASHLRRQSNYPTTRTWSEILFHILSLRLLFLVSMFHNRRKQWLSHSLGSSEHCGQVANTLQGCCIEINRLKRSHSPKCPSIGTKHRGRAHRKLLGGGGVYLEIEWMNFLSVEQLDFWVEVVKERH